MSAESLDFIKKVAEDFPEYFKNISLDTLEEDSNNIFRSVNSDKKIVATFINYERLQRILNVNTYLKSVADSLRTDDFIVITCAGPMAENDNIGKYFEPITMDEIRDALDLDRNFTDWNLIYANGNKNLYCWAIR